MRGFPRYLLEVITESFDLPEIPTSCSLLSALFGVGVTPAFKILMAVPVTYGLALQKFIFYVILPMRMVLRHFAKFNFNVKVAFVSSCFHSRSLTQVT